MSRVCFLQVRRAFSVCSARAHENPLGIPRKSSQAPQIPSRGGLPVRQKIPGVKKIVVVASGKGGVGKSTVSANLAVGLSKLNLNVGLLDADVFGPSVPKLMNLSGEPRLSDNKLQPLVNYGIQTMSMGYLIPTEQSAIVWRGLMVMKALQQLLFEVAWSNVDVLVIDMPPGTGDVQLTISQQCKVDGAVIVSTSQDVALIDVQKGMTMFEKVKIPIMGLVENMSYYQCPNCNHQEHIFGDNGVADEAAKQGVEVIASVPLNKQICLQSDKGMPISVNESDPLAKPYLDLAKKVKQKLGV
ncbi:unnamed protein product [Kuraishia capsulata CBS 1993]|uniref:Iron-sulfur protein NUBPL n=1 Tax=Kuraishia capsulata CBS 1993 TaxID=1382522 RepID=W6MGD1_9ASCO|nr:uncharacterized protein KUCA_T00000813001 [Kuraishia capsulata CBS 1993]CDK24846.1 unnamed protein product [Kuraishia capsulata CBS 1993]